MEPTTEEATAIRTLNEAAEWAGLPGEPAGADNPRGSWFKLLGFVGTEPVRQAAMLPEADWQTLLATWQVKGQAPLPAHLVQAGLLGRTVRIVCGTQLRAEVIAKNAADDLALELDKAKAASTAPVPSTTALALAGTTVKLAEVIDQTAQGEAQKLWQGAIDEAYGRYETRLGGEPPSGPRADD